MTAASSGEKAPEGNPDDTEVLDKEEGNLVMALISQCESPRSHQLSLRAASFEWIFGRNR
jgi:hypothetical protein